MSTESTELVVLNNSTPTVYQEPEDNWGDDDEEIKPQYIQLRQSSTNNADHVPMGNFFDKASGQVWKEVDMVILDMHPARGWKPSAPTFVAGEKMLCRSNNGKVPITGYGLIPQAKDCFSCKKASWDGYNSETKTGVKPPCEKAYYVLFIDKKTKLPYIYYITGKNNIKAAAAMKSAVKSQAELAKADTGRRPSTYEFTVKMGAEKDGKYWRPKFISIGKLNAESAAEFGGLFKQFTASRNTQVDEPLNVTDSVYSEDTGAVDEITEI